jgi:hypothetical protein
MLFQSPEKTNQRMDACLSYHPAIQGAQFAPRRIARKPRTSFAHHSEATALQLLKVEICAWWMVNSVRTRRRPNRERKRGSESLTPGSKLPTESNLAGLLYVSRTTIRSALNLLEQEGEIERKTGQGRIVRQSHAVE